MMITKKRNNIIAILMAILMVFAMMPMTAETVFAEADTDTQAPVVNLESFTLMLPEGKDRASVGDTITATAEVTDDRYVNSVVIDLHTPVTGDSRRINLAYTGADETRSGVWTGTYTITDDDENGVWKIEYISANDGYNESSCSNNKVYNWGNTDLSAYDFEVYGTSSDPDVTPAVINLESFTLTLPDGKDKATVGDTITAAAEVTDDRCVNSVVIDLHTPVTGDSRRIDLAYTGTDETKSGIWTGTYTITDEDENGVWKIEYISANDGYNESSCSNNKVYNWGNTDLSAYDFEVYGTSSDPDVTPAVINLENFTLALPDGKDKASVGDTITATVEVTDDRYVESVFVDLHTPVTGGYRRIDLAYTGTDETKSGIWTGTYTITDEDENGIWKIEQISANDGHNESSCSNNKVYNWGNTDLSAYDFEVASPDCPLDLNDSGYSMMLDGIGATTTSGGVYYVNEVSETVTPAVKVRYEDQNGNWTTLAPRKYTLKYEKKTGEDSWEDYTADTFGVDEDGTATYRVSATGKESLYYTGTVGPVEFNVIKKCKITFDTHGGNSIDPQCVIPGEKASKPADPTREGWHFGGEWYSDPELTTTFNFNNPVTEDVTLYAGWYAYMSIGVYNQSNPQNYQCGTVDIETASADDPDYTDVATMNFTVPEGEVWFAAKPAAGYKFKGFYKGVVGSSHYVEKPSDELLTDNTEYACDAGAAAICAVFECAGHQWDDGTVTKTATCKEMGTKVFKCTVCGAEKTEDIAIDPNAHQWKTVVDKAATCTATGSEHQECSACGIVREGSEKTTPAGNHKFGSWTTTKKATELAAGQQTRRCSACGKAETKAIAKLNPSLPAVKITKPKAAKKKITVKWKKVSKKNQKNIKGIEIQVATDSGFKNIVKTAKGSKKTTSKVIKGLKPKTKYFVRIRAYAAGDRVSVWKSKSVKVK